MLKPAAQIAPALVEDAAVREAAAEVAKVANSDCGNCSKSRDVDPGRDVDDYATVRPETWREADHDCLGMLWQFDLDCRSLMSEVKSPSAAASPGAVHTAAAAPVIPPAAMGTTTRTPADSDADAAPGAVDIAAAPEIQVRCASLGEWLLQRYPMANRSWRPILTHSIMEPQPIDLETIQNVVEADLACAANLIREVLRTHTHLVVDRPGLMHITEGFLPIKLVRYFLDQYTEFSYSQEGDHLLHIVWRSGSCAATSGAFRHFCTRLFPLKFSTWVPRPFK